MAGATASSSVTAASSTSQTPSPDPSSSSAATCRPSLVLPHPPAPVRVTRREDSTRARTSDSSRSRPMNADSWAGRLFGGTRAAAAANAPGGLPYTAASTSSAGARPRAADRNSSRAGPARLRAPASKTAVSLCAVRWMPRSRSLTDRGLSPAASASSSCVIWASARSRRSSPANESAGCSAMAPMSLDPPAAPPRRGTRPFPTVCPGPPLPSPASAGWLRPRQLVPPQPRPQSP